MSCEPRLIVAPGYQDVTICCAENRNGQGFTEVVRGHFELEDVIVVASESVLRSKGAMALRTHLTLSINCEFPM